MHRSNLSGTRFHNFLMIGFASFLLSACASVDTTENDEITEAPYAEESIDETQPTVVSYDDYRDPLEVINRPLFRFNHVTYRYVLSPLAGTWQKIVPEPVDRGVTNFFTNLHEPMYSLNHLFQGRVGGFGKSLLRFGVNTSIGLLGLFDPADAWFGIERQASTLSDTLSHYGVGYGIYLVLPVLGPSDIRDVSSMTFEYVTHPLTYVDDKEETVFGLRVLDGFHERRATLADYPDMVREVEDPYSFVRNLYLQRALRDAEFRQHVEETNNDDED